MNFFKRALATQLPEVIPRQDDPCFEHIISEQIIIVSNYNFCKRSSYIGYSILSRLSHEANKVKQKKSKKKSKISILFDAICYVLFAEIYNHEL